MHPSAGVCMALFACKHRGHGLRMQAHQQAPPCDLPRRCDAEGGTALQLSCPPGFAYHPGRFSCQPAPTVPGCPRAGVDGDSGNNPYMQGFYSLGTQACSQELDCGEEGCVAGACCSGSGQVSSLQGLRGCPCAAPVGHATCNRMGMHGSQLFLSAPIWLHIGQHLPRPLLPT